MSHYAINRTEGVTPRTIANVLLDLKEARGDWEAADRAALRAPVGSVAEDEAANRMTAADERVDVLRAEFRAMFVRATGSSWSQIEAAIEGGLL